MFTGLVQRIGRLDDLAQTPTGHRVHVTHGAWDAPLEAGESVAVQGACLTVTTVEPTGFTSDVLDETLQRTNLASKAAGARVNLERALRMGDPVGGHLVTGHVDGLGTLDRLGRAGHDWVLRVRCAPPLMTEIALKGSVACDGISLTVSGVDAAWFEVRIIPFTREQTSLSERRPGDTLNIETDLIAKYVRRSLDPTAGSATVDETLLKRTGFV